MGVGVGPGVGSGEGEGDGEGVGVGLPGQAEAGEALWRGLTAPTAKSAALLLVSAQRSEPRSAAVVLGAGAGAGPAPSEQLAEEP